VNSGPSGRAEIFAAIEAKGGQNGRPTIIGARVPPL
jgi:hypothetical protein